MRVKKKDLYNHIESGYLPSSSADLLYLIYQFLSDDNFAEFASFLVEWTQNQKVQKENELKTDIEVKALYEKFLRE